MKKYIDISGFDITQSNRGNAALSYGSLGFLESKGMIKEGQELISFHKFNNPFKWDNIRIINKVYNINGKEWHHKTVPVFSLEKVLAKKFGIYLPFTPFGHFVRQVSMEAADYGGDGFSDIYGDRQFYDRMSQTYLLWKAGVPLIMLPQTIGPFRKRENYEEAIRIIKHAKSVYVRDDKFCQELDNLKIPYTRTKDISSFMKPEPWDIMVPDNAVGLNVSGLAYCNNFRGLEGQFDMYPELITRIIRHFQQKGCPVFLIPHSYTFNCPDDNDDMVACRKAYERLQDKNNVILIDKDLSAPQVKYIISKMSFFIGARMHANFAAIYTGVPVFGTAYSYKFEGAFNANGLDGNKQTSIINNIKEKDIDALILKIQAFYEESVKNK